MAVHFSAFRRMLWPEGGSLVAIGLGKKAILVAMSTGSVEKLGEGVEVATANIREVLRKESG